MQEFTAQRRGNDNLVKVYLNDRKDYIVIDTDDPGFLRRFAGFIKWVDEYTAELEEKGKEAEQKFEGRPMITEDEEGNQVVDPDQLLALMDIRIAAFQECVKKIDEIFGAGTCEKFFIESYEANPDFVPDDEAINDFIEALQPIIEKAYAIRFERLGKKYSKTRRTTKK